MLEIWKTVPQSNYESSNLGRVRNPHGKVLRPTLNKNGYLSVVIGFDSGRKRVTVHRTIANTFLGLGNTVNHKDSNRANNFLSNLELCSLRENIRHKFKGNKRFVSFNKATKKWAVMIRGKDGTQQYFGRYPSKSQAYEIAYKKYFNIYGVYPWERA